MEKRGSWGETSGQRAGWRRTIQTWKDRKQQKQKNRGTEKGREQKGKPRERQEKDVEVL